LIYFNVTREFPLLLLIGGISSFALLVILWIIHINVQNKIEYSNGIIDICKKSIDRITGEWTSFEDTGIEFADTEHSYVCDLDIAGSKSLFQFLNSTNTWHGRQRFANDLLYPTYERSEIIDRQKAVAELAEYTDFSNKIQYHLSKIGVDSSAQELVSALEDKVPFIKSKLLKFFLVYAPALTLAFIIGIIAFQMEHLYTIGIIIALIQTIIWIAGIAKTKKYLKTLMRLPYSLSNYSAAIDILCRQEFSSGKLKKMQGELYIASKAIKELSKISDKVRATQNGILYVLFNVFFLWDYECACLLEKWKNKHADFSKEWFETLGEFESLLCFSHLPNACNNTCIPLIADETIRNMSELPESDLTNTIEALQIGHPLLQNDARVNNDINLKDNIFIISGSNMSGKTTFLRTVGINLVLARCGSFVCAQFMNCSPLEIITSMRIEDNLNEGISTFYAELKRIKSILEFTQNSSQMIFLIDEIFRGTNSVDRLIGAKTVLAKLNDVGASGIISTHDLELCHLSIVHERIKNYSFSEHYDANSIQFDYQLQPGKSKTTNAKYLMNMVGIT